MKPVASAFEVPADQLPTHSDRPDDWFEDWSAPEPVKTRADPASDTAAARAADLTVLGMRMEQPPNGLARDGREIPGTSGGDGNLVPDS